MSLPQLSPTWSQTSQNTHKQQAAQIGRQHSDIDTHRYTIQFWNGNAKSWNIPLKDVISFLNVQSFLPLHELQICLHTMHCFLQKTVYLQNTEPSSRHAVFSFWWVQFSLLESIVYISLPSVMCYSFLKIPHSYTVCDVWWTFKSVVKMCHGQWHGSTPFKKKQFCSRDVLLTGCKLSWKLWIKKLCCTVAKIRICRRMVYIPWWSSELLALCCMIKWFWRRNKSCSRKIMEMAADLPFEKPLRLEELSIQ